MQRDTESRGEAGACTEDDADPAKSNNAMDVDKEHREDGIVSNNLFEKLSGRYVRGRAGNIATLRRLNSSATLANGELQGVLVDGRQGPSCGMFTLDRTELKTQGR